MKIEKRISQLSWKMIGMVVIGTFVICVSFREIVLIHIWNNATASVNSVINQENANLNVEKTRGNAMQSELDKKSENTFPLSDDVLKSESQKIHNLHDSF
jgi:uncharacterized protein YbcI